MKREPALVGYYHYYGITDNGPSLDTFRFKVIGMLFYWLNRRSHRESYTWKGLEAMFEVYPIAYGKVYVNV